MLLLSLQRSTLPSRLAQLGEGDQDPPPDAFRNTRLLPESSKWAAKPVIFHVLPGFVPKTHTPTPLTE